MVCLKAESPIGDDLPTALRNAAEVAHRLGVRISFYFNGQWQCVGPQDHKPAEHKTNKPKLRYEKMDGTLWSDVVIRHVSRLEQSRKGEGYFICESITQTAARIIAELLGGYFIGTEQFTETF